MNNSSNYLQQQNQKDFTDVIGIKSEVLANAIKKGVIELTKDLKPPIAPWYAKSIVESKVIPISDFIPTNNTEMGLFMGLEMIAKNNNSITTNTEPATYITTNTTNNPAIKLKFPVFSATKTVEIIGNRTIEDYHIKAYLRILSLPTSVATIKLAHCEEQEPGNNNSSDIATLVSEKSFGHGTIYTETSVESVNLFFNKEKAAPNDSENGELGLILLLQPSITEPFSLYIDEHFTFSKSE
jgi:hypothetical protein